MSPKTRLKEKERKLARRSYQEAVLGLDSFDDNNNREVVNIVAVCRQRRTEILRNRTKTHKTFLKLNINNPQIKLDLVFIYSDINRC